MVSEQQHTQEPGSDRRQAREALTVRSLLNDLAVVLGITVPLASLMLPARLTILVLIASPPLLLVLRVAGHRPIAEVATDFIQAAHRLDGAVVNLGNVSWRFLVASVLALAMITTQATSVVRDRLEVSPAADVVAALQQASNALLVLTAHNHAVSVKDLAMLRATASTMAHAHRALADPSTQGRARDERAKLAALAAMSARNLAILRATTSAMAHARRALADPSTERQALNEEGAKLMALTVKSLAMLRATTSATAHTSRALTQQGPVTTMGRRLVRP